MTISLPESLTIISSLSTIKDPLGPNLKSNFILKSFILGIALNSSGASIISVISYSLSCSISIIYPYFVGFSNTNFILLGSISYLHFPSLAYQNPVFCQISIFLNTCFMLSLLRSPNSAKSLIVSLTSCGSLSNGIIVLSLVSVSDRFILIPSVSLAHLAASCTVPDH